MTPIIEVKGLSKKYRIGENQPYITLRDTLAEVIKNPFGKIKEGLRKDEFWALKDINFTVEPGEVVGIIGHNGAGKSTLLKILSRITPPTQGEVIMRGRVGSLLEVGTGFQQELTGRENIFLNGAILGMTQREIKRKFDEIVDFAEVEKFIDTPVKHYSSGMYMRLAFSIAAHLDPEILIVDEVLAVGDAEFQKKCLGKMDEVSKKQGKTIIYVSHALDSLSKLCEKSIVLDYGVSIYCGRTESAIKKYIDLKQASRGITTSSKKENRSLSNKVASFQSVALLDLNGLPIKSVIQNQPFIVELKIRASKSLIPNIVSITFVNETMDDVLTTFAHDTITDKVMINKGVNTIKVRIDPNPFVVGDMSLRLACLGPNFTEYDHVLNAFTFSVLEKKNASSLVTRPGKIYFPYAWSINEE